MLSRLLSLSSKPTAAAWQRYDRLFPSLSTFRHSSSTSSSSSPSSPETDGGADVGSELVETIFGISLRRDEYHPNLLKAISLENASTYQKRLVNKLSIVQQYRRSESDTGSPEVQIALLSEKIKNLTRHLLDHKKDKTKKRDMDVALSQRRRMMKYLLRKSPERYMKITEQLGIRPNSVFADDKRKGAKIAPKRNLSQPKA